MSTINNRAILSFYTNAGAVVKLSIPRANMSKVADAARAGMAAILATDAVVIGGAVPRVIRSAELVQTGREIMINNG